jgi:hypothetical protein
MKYFIGFLVCEALALACFYGACFAMDWFTSQLHSWLMMANFVLTLLIGMPISIVMAGIGLALLSEAFKGSSSKDDL